MLLPDEEAFEFAVGTTSSDRLDLLPPTVTEEAVSSHADELGAYYRGLAKNGRHLHRVPTVHGWKSSTGLRPIATMTVLQRVAFRALGFELQKHLDPPERTPDEHQSFAQAPVDAGVNYVVLTDVASFYGFVAHDQLAMEILRRTGEEYLAETTARLLDAYTERSFGLPQTASTSDLLSEVYIDTAHRAVVRDGIAIWRFNDDFRLGAPSYRAAQRALLSLSEHLDEIGLVLNEAKTWVMRADTYAASLQRPEEAEERIEDQAEIEEDHDIWTTSEYGESELDEEPTPAEEFVDRLAQEAVRVLELWKSATTRGSQESHSRLELSKLRSFASRAIGIMGAFQNTTAMPFLDSLLALEPQLSPQVSRYLLRVSREGAADVEAWFEESARRIARLTEWQKVWLLEPLIANHQWSDQAIAPWVRQLFESSSNPYVRSRAALCLGWSDQAEIGELRDAFSGSPEGFRADVAAAVVARTGQQLQEVTPELARESLEVRLVADWFHRQHATRESDGVDL